MRRLAWILALLMCSPMVVAGQNAFDLKAMLDAYARGEYDRAVGMAPADLGLAEEARRDDGRGKLRTQHFDRHRFTALEIVREKHERRSTCPKTA